MNALDYLSINLIFSFMKIKTDWPNNNTYMDFLDKHGQNMEMHILFFLMAINF